VTDQCTEQNSDYHVIVLESRPSLYFIVTLLLWS
jgi:hypothetical protein